MNNLTLQKAEIEAALSGSKMELSREVSAVKVESAAQAKNLAAVYDRRLADFRAELQAKHKADVDKIEDQKALDIQVTVPRKSR